MSPPLPKDLTGSKYLLHIKISPPPETYFLMKQSKDSYVSATGRFQIAFLWTLHAEEKAERNYLKSKDISQDAITGNI